MSCFEDINFDPDTYIEEEYKNAPLYDLNMALSLINKELNENETSSKNLVSHHFDKFIECRTVLESIHSHLIENNELKRLMSLNFKSLNSLIIPQYGSLKRKEELKKEFGHLFNLKSSLENAESHEDFLFYCKCAHGDLQRAKNSRYLNVVWQESSHLRVVFLAQMCMEIEKNAHHFREMFHFFDMYFEMEKIQTKSGRIEDKDSKVTLESPNTQEYKQKIENTILVNTKIAMLKIFDSKDLIASIEETKYGLIKLLESDVSSGIKNEIMGVYVNLFIRHIKRSKVDLMLYNFLIKECQDLIFIITPKIDSAVKCHAITMENEMINEMAERIIFSSIDSDLPIKPWSDTFIRNIKSALKILRDLDKTLLKENIKDVLLNRVTANQNIEEVRYVKENLLNKVGSTLKVNMTEMKTFYDQLQEFEEDEVEDIIKEYEMELKDINKIKYGTEELNIRNEKLLCATMMLVLKIINDYPRSYVKIMNRLSSQIESNVSHYFLKEICYKYDLVINDADRMLLEKYKKMFGFLINDDTMESDVEKRSLILGEEAEQLINRDGEMRFDLKTMKSTTKESSKNNTIPKDSKN